MIRGRDFCRFVHDSLPLGFVQRAHASGMRRIMFSRRRLFYF